MPQDRDDREFEEQWERFIESYDRKACGSDGIAAASRFECLTGRRFGTKLIITDGLYVALARTDRELENAADELLALRKERRDDASGVIVLSRDLASQTFGAVPIELINSAISWHPSADELVIDGALAFIKEYFDIRDMTRHGLLEVAE